MPERPPLTWNMILPDGQPLRFDMGPEFTWDGKVPEIYYQNQNNPMSQDLISATITQAFADGLKADFAAIRAKQAAFLLALTAAQKATLLKMGTGNMAFESVVRTAANENPGKLSADFPMAKWDQDRAFAAVYSEAFAVGEKLMSDMRDTLLAAHSDAYTAATEAYADLKRDAVGPAIDQARAMMRARHGPKPPASPTPPHP